ncbi:MAG: nicotinate-nucleotide adenylyltransferase [Rhodocyclaceae bacterium]|nr:MAG: nicotinate-nucleotide adenylyltransferase [Rhodocyclaceae bacterium]
MSDVDTGVLGLFGGTFDPLHVAHLRLAIEAREALGLAEVCFIPAGNPALRNAPRCAAEHRMAMVERALADAPGFSVDVAEVMNAASEPGPSYTVETLERQRRLHGPRRPLVLLLGADAFGRLESWHRWAELFDFAHIAVATRPGHELIVGPGGTALSREFATRRGEASDLANAPAGRIVPFAITALEISATAIRQRLAQGLSVRYLVPDAVLDYIDSHQIYRTSHGY